jgi:4-alpha-glucanotransferase
MPFIAEDLGDKMENVYRFRDELGLPGMRVLQFGFGDNIHSSVDVPHVYPENCMVYTGTHDNNTTVGWFRKEADDSTRARLSAYAGMNVTQYNVHEVMMRLAFTSVAKIAVIPFQDIAGLDETHRTNTPGTITGNWTWRPAILSPGEATESWLRQMLDVTGRL